MPSSTTPATTPKDAADALGTLRVHEIAPNRIVVSSNAAGDTEIARAGGTGGSGFRYLDLVNAADQLRVDGLLREAFLGELLEFEFLSVGETPTRFAARFLPIRDASGVVTRVVAVTQDWDAALAQDLPTRSGVAHDTFAEAAVSERDRAQQALDLSQIRFRAFAEIAADYFWQAGTDDRLTYMSDRFEAIAGVSSLEVIGKNRQEVWALGQAKLVWQGVGSAETPQEQQSYDLEIDWIRPNDGERRVLFIRAISMFGIDGEFEGYRGIGRDITSQKDAAREHERLESALRQSQKMQAVGQLTGGIAHDFNNILSSVLGFTELLQVSLRDSADAKSQNYLREIHRAGERARDLVSQMLAFSRAGDSSATVLDVSSVVLETVRLLKSTLPSRVEISTRIETHLPAVLIDPVQLQQVVMNLCINARDAINGHGRIEVAVDSRTNAELVCSSCQRSASGDFLVVEVRDSGDGIPDDTLSRVFDPFFTTKEVGKGSGMGLSMVHGIVHGHAGHLELETRAREGSVFRLFFPSAPQEVKETKESLSVEADVPTHAGNRRVMVVDDERSVARFLIELLHARGFAAQAYASGAEALEALIAEPRSFDVVITDQTMPAMSGLELAEKMQSQGLSTPVILCTGNRDWLDQDNAERLGVLACLSKPINSTELLKLVADVKSD